MKRKKYRPRVTTEQTKLINMFTLGGLSQKNIAKQLGLPPVTVGNVQRVLGIASRSGRLPLPTALEDKIIKMRKKHGSPTIARLLGLPQWRVEDVFRERRFLQTPGKISSRYYVNDREKRAIRRKQRAFEREISKQFGVSEIWMRRFLRRRSK
jgi:transposase